MAFICDRNGESLEWFLTREKIYGSREDAVSDIKAGKVTINGKVKKDPEYKPKKKDEFIIVDIHQRKYTISFTVAE